MSNDPIGLALAGLRRLSGSTLIDRLRLRKPMDRVIQGGTAVGFRAASQTRKAFKPLLDLTRPARLKQGAGGDLFDLTLSEDQEMFRDAVRRVVNEQISPAAHAADTDNAVPAEILQQIHDLGIGLLSVPDEAGGAGSEAVQTTQVIIAEELSRGDMAIALAALAPLSVINTLVSWGSAAQQAKYLPVLTGETYCPATLAVTEPAALFDPHAPATTARRRDGGYVLNGEKSLVPLAESAELLLVLADVEDLGPRLFCIEQGSDGLTFRDEPSMGLRAASLGRLRLDDVKVDEEALIAADDFDLNAFVSRTRIAWSALSVGTCQAVLDYVSDYVKDRKAFGEPIAHRQAVAFMVANIAIELEGMRLMLWRAASRAEQGLDYQREAYLAHLQCSEYAMQIGTDGVQLLGGHGFITEHPVERWYRNLRAISVCSNGALI